MATSIAHSRIQGDPPEDLFSVREGAACSSLDPKPSYSRSCKRQVASASQLQVHQEGSLKIGMDLSRHGRLSRGP